jgi:hypothetical protein
MLRSVADAGPVSVTVLLDGEPAGDVAFADVAPELFPETGRFYEIAGACWEATREYRGLTNEAEHPPEPRASTSGPGSSVMRPPG